jgi:hypothetical protein
MREKPCKHESYDNDEQNYLLRPVHAMKQHDVTEGKGKFNLSVS